MKDAQHYWSLIVNAVQHLKVNQDNSLYQQTKEEKPYDHLSRCRESIWQNLTSIHDKTLQQMRNRRELPQKNYTGLLN